MLVKFAVCMCCCQLLSALLAVHRVEHSAAGLPDLCFIQQLLHDLTAGMPDIRAALLCAHNCRISDKLLTEAHTWRQLTPIPGGSLHLYTWHVVAHCWQPSAQQGQACALPQPHLSSESSFAKGPVLACRKMALARSRCA